ncbi:MAG TPA: glycosyltransferase family 39 protein [Anaerolineae bacterium]|nr:glycosyltransferase family 39 protein [Anaerolineae bacterium]
MALLTAVLLYLSLALAQLDLPGLHYDEAREAGLNALEMLQRQDVQAFRASGVQVGAVFLPLMVQDYIGALNVYLALPLLALLGVTVPALRLVGVACGLATLLLVWGLGRELSRRTRAESTGAAGWTGEIAALLLAVNPTFIFWSRQGVFVTNVVVTLAVASVWLGLRWQRTGRPRALYGLAVLAGLGLWSKLLFLWVLGAMAGVAAAAWLVSRLRGNASPLPRPTLRSLLLAGLLFLLALSPLLLFNQQTSGTVQSIFGNLGQSYYGVENAAFQSNLVVRLGQVRTLLRGDHLWYLGGTFANGWALWIGVGLVIVALTLAALGWRSGRDRASLPVLLLALLFVALLLVQSSFTVSDLFVTHYAIVQPFVVLLIALAADIVLKSAGRGSSREALQVAGGRRRALLATCTLLLVTVWLGVDAQTSLRYHQALARSGGLATHSDAIGTLAQWLDGRDAQQPLALDWGIDAQVRYLTANRVRPLEIFGYERLDAPDPGFAGRAAQFLHDPTRLFIVRSPEETVFQGRRAALEDLAAAQGLTLVTQEVIYDRSGRAMFEILGIKTP